MSHRIALRGLAALALVAACAPLLQPGFVGGHEGPAYLFRAAEFAGQLFEGETRPRWCPDFYWGYGYPFFVYYPPGLFYLAAVGIAAGLSAAASLEIATALGWVLLLFGVRRLARCWTSEGPALVAAVAAVLATYRLTQVHARGDLAEAFATGVAPWVLAEFVILSRASSDRSWMRAARAGVLLGAVFYLHTLSAVAVCMAVGAIGLWATATRGREGVTGTLRAAGAGGVGVLLGASYWVPAYFGQGVVRTDDMLDRVPGEFSWWYGDHFVRWWQRFDPTLAFGDSVPGPADTMSFGSSPVVWIAALVAVAAMRDPTFRARAAGPVAALGVLNVGMLELAEPVWRVAPLLPWFQFPWRLLVLEGMAAAVVVALVVQRLGEGRRWVPTAAAVALLLAAAPSVLAAWANAGDHPVRLMPDQAAAIEDPRRLQTVGAHHPRGTWYAVTTAAMNEYLPRSVLAPPSSHPDAPGRVRRLEDLGPPTDESGAWRRWVVDLPAAGVYEVAWFAFPGLRAARDGEPLPLLEPARDGLVRFELPAGRQVVEVWYARPPQQPVANAVTALGLVALLGLTRRDRLSG